MSAIDLAAAFDDALSYALMQDAHHAGAGLPPLAEQDASQAWRTTAGRGPARADDRPGAFRYGLEGLDVHGCVRAGRPPRGRDGEGAYGGRDVSESADKTTVWAYECPCCWESYEPWSKPDDGRCHACDDQPNLRRKQSQFGAGIVVCLAKFSEHMWTRSDRTIVELAAHLEGTLPYEKLSDDAKRKVDFERRYHRDREVARAALEDAVHMWASGAGDHFYDLDRGRAPVPLIALADLVLSMRNTHMGSDWRWSPGDWNRVRGLWRDSCIALDRLLGTTPNWGEY